MRKDNIVIKALSDQYFSLGGEIIGLHFIDYIKRQGGEMPQEVKMIETMDKLLGGAMDEHKNKMIRDFYNLARAINWYGEKFSDGDGMEVESL